MKLTVLTENYAGAGFGAEHGLAYLIDYKGSKILFDSGHTHLFLRNAELLNVDLQKEVDFIVLSHGHWDHGDGLGYFSSKPLITHPDSFIKRYRKGDHSYIGLAMGYEEMSRRYDITLTSAPYKLSEDVIFLGEIPRINDFEAQTTAFEKENGQSDFVMDDSAIVITDKQGLIVVTGCSHAGICNIIEHARVVTGIDHVHTVIGGFHLKHNNRQTRLTIEYMRAHGIKNIYPSHCTRLPALTEFYNAFKTEQVKTGSVFEF